MEIIMTGSYQNEVKWILISSEATDMIVVVHTQKNYKAYETSSS